MLNRSFQTNVQGNEIALRIVSEALPEMAQILWRDNDVEVWQVSLATNSDCVSRCYQLLGADEQTRAQRFHSKPARRQFILTRGYLRVLLGSHLRTAPQRLKFSYSEFGKPELRSEDNQPGIQFNVSHSQDVSLVAIATDRPIGVDIEYMRAGVHFSKLSQFLSPHEQNSIRAMPMECQREELFKCWVRKEAYLKARGDGLTAALDQFAVSIKADDEFALLNREKSHDNDERWTVKDVPMPGDYVAAFALENIDSAGDVPPQT